MEQLTRLGVLRRQRPLAMAALEEYDIEPRRVALVSHGTNYIYRVTTQGGDRYAMRLTAPYWRTEENLVAETMWLEALERDTSLALPKVVRTRSGEPFVRLRPGHGRPDRRVLVMRWLPGVGLAHRLTRQNIRKMGELFAALHRHAGSWQPPAGFPPQVFDRYLCRGEAEKTFEREYLDVLEADERRTLLEARSLVTAAYASLDADDLRVIHCDLWHENIRCHRGVLAPFDFEDTVIGYRLHDIAMAMLDLAETVGVERYEGLLEEFRSAYETVLPFPDGDLLALQLGRELWLINWFANNQPERYAEAARFHIGIIDRAMQHGRLIGPLSR